jgi:hypothetical protein
MDGWWVGGGGGRWEGLRKEGRTVILHSQDDEDARAHDVCVCAALLERVDEISEEREDEGRAWVV